MSERYAKLIRIIGEKDDTVIALAFNQVTIGSSMKCQIFHSDPSLAEFQARIDRLTNNKKKGYFYHLINLGSNNGTWIRKPSDGKWTPVEDIRLLNGDIIAFGLERNVIYRFEDPNESDAD